MNMYHSLFLENQVLIPNIVFFNHFIKEEYHQLNLLVIVNLKINKLKSMVKIVIIIL